MRTITQNFVCIDGEHRVQIDVFAMSGAEAVDVHGLAADRFASGGYRIEGFINGTPRGTRYCSFMLGAEYIGDTDDGREMCAEFLAAARKDGFLPSVKA